MKKGLYLSLASASLLYSNENIQLPSVDVISEVNTKIVKDVSKEQIKSADLAEALVKNVPSVSLVRRSGIANDIILRGQKKDNINILIDNSKIYGACPNRMDPPTSHILTNNIESVEIIEGPYDVENFGTLSGLVKVNTKEPEAGLNGEVNLGVGSFGYKKGSFTVSGGNDFIKVLLSASKEESDQYEDGNGDDFYGQQIKHGTANPNRYSSSDLEAYEKTTLYSKVIFNIDDSSDLALSYMANRSDNVLYPNTPMDADYDDSDIYTLEYTKRNLGSFSKELNLEYYYSKVDHPMSTRLRNNAMMSKNMTNHMKSSIWGTKLKNSFDISDYLVTLGLDTSVRNWRGNKFNSDRSFDSTSLTSTDTTNKALFSKVEKTFGALDLQIGFRYDNTDIEPTDSLKTDKKYIALSGNIFGIYNIDKDTKIFAGVGKSSRVPDARELYMGANNNLEDTKNYEVDLGFEKDIGNLNVRTKVFYSKLDDYIYNSGGFTNIDAKIYGADISGTYKASDKFSFDYGLAYQRGKKDGDYADKDLAEIPPLKANIALNYEQDSSTYRAELVAVDSWDTYDSSAKEQELSGYAIVNVKYNNQFNKNLGLTFGIDNLFDKNYASTNTYEDVRYVESGGERVLLNDPGRYIYVNLKYTF